MLHKAATFRECDLLYRFFFSFRFRDIEIVNSEIKKPSFSALKRQNPFIQLLTEGKKLREQTTQTNTNNNAELSEEEYLEKLKEIRMMNAQERKHLYEKYGRARSGLTKFEADTNHLNLISSTQSGIFFHLHIS